MAKTYVVGDAVTNATSYELLEKDGNTYNKIATQDKGGVISFEVSALGLTVGDHVLVVQAKGDEAKYLASDYSDPVTYTVTDEGWIDITDQFVFTEGAMIDAKTGKYTTYSGWVATEQYVDLSAYSEIEIKMSKTSSTGTGSGNAFYDADKNYVSGIVHTDGVATYGTMVKNVVLESNMKYIRAMYWSKSNSNYKTEFGDFYCKAKLKA